MVQTTEIDFSGIRDCENIIGYKFKKPLLLWHALPFDKSKKRPASQGSGPSSSPVRLRKNEHHEKERKRLADLGSNKLDLILAEKCYLNGKLDDTSKKTKQTTTITPLPVKEAASAAIRIHQDILDASDDDLSTVPDVIDMPDAEASPIEEVARALATDSVRAQHTIHRLDIMVERQQRVLEEEMQVYNALKDLYLAVFSKKDVDIAAAKQRVRKFGLDRINAGSKVIVTAIAELTEEHQALEKKYDDHPQDRALMATEAPTEDTVKWYNSLKKS
ncbi:MAG: hypothetical protein Q9212_004292 [Teloschistes hypoglaucus]